MCHGKLVLALPDWIGPFLEKQDSVFKDIEDRMRSCHVSTSNTEQAGRSGPVSLSGTVESLLQLV